MPKPTIISNWHVLPCNCSENHGYHVHYPNQEGVEVCGAECQQLVAGTNMPLREVDPIPFSIECGGDAVSVNG